jgi:hypothetical protein
MTQKCANVVNEQRRRWRKNLPRVGVQDTHLMDARGKPKQEGPNPGPLLESTSSTMAFVGELVLYAAGLVKLSKKHTLCQEYGRLILESYIDRYASRRPIATVQIRFLTRRDATNPNPC